MDDRISSAVYNPANPYDTSTVIGNQQLTESWEAPIPRRDFRSSVKFGLMQLGIFALIGVGFAIFG